MRCRLAQWNMSSAIDERRAPAAWVLRHAQRCTACAQFRARLYTLDAALATSIDGALAPVVEPRRRFARPVLGTLVIAAAAGAVFFVSRPGDDAPAGPAHEPGPVVLEPDTASPSSPSAAESSPVWIQVAQTIEPERQLRGELHALVADARGGIDHILDIVPLRR